jgi:hypothetical protein
LKSTINARVAKEIHALLRGIHTSHQVLMQQSLLKNPASPAKAGAHGRHESRLSPVKLGGGAGLDQLNGSDH